MLRRLLLCLALAAGLGSLSAATQAAPVDPRRGVDPRVDYASLARISPWDDRNYLLTREDLALLSPAENEYTGALPVFFRVLMRRARPELPKSGPMQYPHSALPLFLRQWGGYLIDGKLYRGVEREDGRYRVVEQDGIEEEQWQAKALAGDVRITPNLAEESAVKIHPLDQSRAIAGSNPTSGSFQWLFRSSDGGGTWTPSTHLGMDDICCDPTVDWSSDGSKAYAGALACTGELCDVVVYRSADGGATWSDLPGSVRRRVSVGGHSDKEYLHVDKSPVSPHRDNLYMTWHDDNVLKISRSTDFGNTWSAPQALSSGTAEQGIGSDITTDRAGNVYYVWPAYSSKRILLRKSTDGGATFGPVQSVSTTNASFIYPIPAMDSRQAFIYASADVDLSTGPFSNTVYLTWNDTNSTESSSAGSNHSLVRVAFSRNGGLTWSFAIPHELNDVTTVDRFHPWISADQNGTVHAIFYDTRRSADRKSVDLFYTLSIDGGATWLLPGQLSSQLSPPIEGSIEWGDYNGLDVVGSQMIATFTDNRNEAGGSSDSPQVYGAAQLGIGTWQVRTFHSTAALDGRIVESSEDSDTGGTFNTGNSGTSAIRIGDDNLDNQFRGFLSFDTSSIPDFAPIRGVQLQCRVGITLGGPHLSLQQMVADQRSGFFGPNPDLELADWNATPTVASATTLLRLTGGGQTWWAGNLSQAGQSAINKTGLTQFRLRFQRDDDDDLSTDYVGCYSGDNATLDNRPRLVVIFQTTF